MAYATPPVWFITGCSTGFGFELGRLLIDAGYPTVVTARDVGKLKPLVDGKDNALALALDVTKQDQVDAAVTATEARFGRLDVLVNNAGYGYQSSIEEGIADEIKAMFDANVFGLAAMTRAVLPGMRERRQGHVVNISSVAGFIGFPGSGYYAASKHAVNAISDALDKEVSPLGIKVMCVEPGPFRTDWAGRSLKQTLSKIEDYKDTAAARMAATAGISGKQAGDPVRASQAIIDAVVGEETPLHLVLGAFGVDAVTSKLKASLDQIERWRQVGVDTDFPA
ncbi:NADP-dependent 3-hydroxy acid dehydrogenase YdfG [Arboricoccus pini]|uniref:NADP-dependent 3-hydroxy acid dehydrogenase YdfG n=1 Tax=Arboricoccus pini TaxID=1963835 RepID=A0A212QPU9_9PROT|nr:oxidoreductase [Arboricoccus pini]SNB61399.1 NADP-dependent 3-hydroxy acid dehydrogenase YdfG [Arboricoccus pini]